MFRLKERIHTKVLLMCLGGGKFRICFASRRSSPERDWEGLGIRRKQYINLGFHCDNQILRVTEARKNGHVLCASVIQTLERENILNFGFICGNNLKRTWTLEYSDLFTKLK